MSVKRKLTFIVTLLSLNLTESNHVNFEDPDPKYDCSYCQPDQIHIAFGEKINDIVITWATAENANESRVQFGLFPGALDKEASGESVKYKDIRGQWIHRVTLKDLQFNSTYRYRCGSMYAWSETFNFDTLPEEETVLRAAIYGDMGTENAHALPYLQQEAENRSVDFILHVGDFAYDMQDKDSAVGDQFMRQVQPFAAIVPFMVCSGNHEYYRNFSQYKSRMTMPNYKETESMFYSWNIGPIHFVSINTEAYNWFARTFLLRDDGPLYAQYNWLVKDLEEANLKENREKRPWIILYGHRPMYCSGSGIINKFECSDEPTRTGIYVWENFKRKVKYGLEPLLLKYGVDIAIWAHEHTYERSWPVYDNVVYNGSAEHPYVNPRAPIHILTGSAGCKEVPDSFASQPEWCAFRSNDYGYTRFYAYNKTHVYFEQISVDLNGTVIDSFWVVQENHGPFSLIKQPTSQQTVAVNIVRT